MAHITGGGIAGNLARPLRDGSRREVDLGSWERPAVFGWLGVAGRRGGRDAAVFNLGLGYAAFVSQDSIELALRRSNGRVTRLGRRRSRPGDGGHSGEDGC